MFEFRFCRLSQVLLAGAALAALAPPAAASDLDDRLGRLGGASGESEAEAAPAEVPAVRAQHAAEKKSVKPRANAVYRAVPPGLPDLRSVDDRLTRLEATAAIPAAAAAAGEAPKPVTLEFSNGRPTIKSADGNFELSLRASFQGDAAAYMQDEGDQGPATTGDQLDLGSGAIIRRARIGVEGRFFKDFVYEIRFDFGGSDAEGSGAINIARVAFVGVPGLRIQAGAFKPGFTLYDSISGGDLTMMERPAVITAVNGPFGGDLARRGIEAAYQAENFLYDGDNLFVSGAWTGARTTNLSGTPASEHSGSSIDDEGTQILGRLAYRVYSDKETSSHVQVGVSGAQILSFQGIAPGTAHTVRFRERPEVRVSGERLVDTGTIPAEDGTLFGAEAGMNFMNFFLAGEYYSWSIDRATSCASGCSAGADPEFDGYYIEASYILTGETKSYKSYGTSNAVGIWAAPKVKHPVGGGGWGAWEVAARYSVLDLNFNEGAAGVEAPTGGIRGGEQSILTFGLNWYLNANLRMMLDYALVDVERLNSAGSEKGQDLSIVQGRVQFAF